MKRLVPVILMLVVAACGGGTSSTPTAPSPSPAPAPSPAPDAQNLVPQALQGIWASALKSDPRVQVTLRLTEVNYVITTPGHSAGGKIAVRGDLIEFFASSACDGTGSYRWSVQGNLLSFTESAPSSDGCSDRSSALNGYTYTRQ